MRHAPEPAQPLSGEVTSRNVLPVFFSLADKWSLTTDQQINLLGAPARSTFFKWKKEGGLISPDTVERVSLLVSIYKALQIIFPNTDAADEWIRRPNKRFDNQSALDVMLRGKVTDIDIVRAYLDAQRGG